MNYEHNKKQYDQIADFWHTQKKDNLNYPQMLIEKPAMKNLLYDLQGKQILSLGCGSGEEFNVLKEFRAKNIVGVDGSEKLLEICKQNYPEIKVICQNLEENFYFGTYDLIYSSLFIHYIKDLDKLAKNIYKSLNDQGYFIFSTQHPASWSGIKNGHELTLGIQKGKDGLLEPVGDYLNTHLKKVKILNDSLEIETWNRSIEQIIKPFLKTGLILEDILEPKPIDFPTYDPYLQSRIKSWQSIPYFVCFKFVKRI